MEQFLVSLSTGGLVEGSYSTLDKAKAAVEAHYHLIRGDRPDRSNEMQWVGDLDTGLKRHVWLMKDSTVRKYPDIPSNSTPDGILTHISIEQLQLDSPLPVV